MLDHNQITIVVPTMWLGLGLQEVLLEAETNPYVGEVILINNAARNSPTWFTSRIWSKVKVLDFGKNIYVNPAWNIGVKNSTYDQICLMNDDIRFDMGVFKFMSDKMGAAQGPAGPVYPTGSVTGPIQIVDDHIFRWTQLYGTASIGWGSLIFVNKSWWLPIPDKLMILAGDDWLYDTSWSRRLIPRTIRNLNIVAQNNQGGTTSLRSEFMDVRDNDRLVRSKLNDIWPTPIRFL